MTANCPLCGVQPADPWRREGRWTVVRCSGCGLLMTWPRPNDAMLESLYCSDSYYEARGMGVAAGQPAHRRAREILTFVTRHIGRVLDFGAGEGHLVAAMRQLGLHAEGIEPSPVGRAAAQRLYRLELSEGLDVGSGHKWDLVTLVHSIEHVSDPVTVLEQLRTVLAPGGLLYVEVPHAESFEIWRSGRRRQILDLPIHLYHFTPSTLRTALGKAGLQVVRVQLSNPDWLEWVLGIRGRWLRRTASHSGTPDMMLPSPAADSAPRTGVRRHWRDDVLPWIREHSPGWKFQVLACSAELPRSPH